MLTIAVDAMGGDRGALDTVAAVAAASLALDAEILLVGHERTLTSLLSEVEHNPERIAVYHAPDAIGQHEEPERAFASKPQSSLHIAMKLLADGLAQALVTTGNQEALVLAARHFLKRIPGVTTPALGAVYPTEIRRGEKDDPFMLLLDVGASMEASAEDLLRFAAMGSAYARCISWNEQPRIALLSNSVQPGSGTAQIVSAHESLSALKQLHFIGNIEPVDIPRGTADVVVCAGFYGSLLLNMLHETYEAVLATARYAHKERRLHNVGMWMLRGGLSRLKAVTDWRQYGGEPLLGYDRVIIKADGSSHARAIVNAMKVATKAVQAELPKRMEEKLNTLK